jgi:P-type conjugative transfer protein TrbJ
MKRKLLAPLAVTLALLFLRPQPSAAQIPVTDVAHIAVSTWAEIARYAQEAYSIIQRALSIYNQVKQIELQVKALRKLGLNSWRDIGPLYYHINQLLDEGESLVYALDDLGERFDETFPGLTRFTDPATQTFNQVTRVLNTFRANLLTLHQVHSDSQGSLQNLGEIQRHVELSEGHEQTLEAIAEFQSWQSDQLATMGVTLQAIANTSAVAASYQVNREAQLRQTAADTVLSSAVAAQRAAEDSSTTYTALPPWINNQ